jgi:hypothetical protein
MRSPRPSRFVPLPAAAASAFQRLASDPRRGERDPDAALDVAAIALAACMPVYGARDPGERLRRLTDDEIARGAFCEGAARLVFRDGEAPLQRLAVDADDLERALERLDDAGVSFSHALFDPTPRYMLA